MRESSPFGGRSRGPDGPRPAGSATPGAGVLYALWGAIGVSVVAEFGVLLALQRAGHVRIEDSGGPVPPWVHVALAAVLFAAAAVLVSRLRARRRAAGDRTLPLDVASWAVAEALALIGFALAVVLQPLPRLAITVYFTGGLFLWLRSRPRTSGGTAPA